MSFGKRLLEAKKNKAISQEDLAEQLSTKGRLSADMKRGDVRPSIGMQGSLSMNYICSYT